MAMIEITTLIMAILIIRIYQEIKIVFVKSQGEHTFKFVLNYSDLGTYK